MKSLLLLLLLPFAVPAQCTLTLDQSPTVRAFKLGTRGVELKESLNNLIGDVGNIPGFEDVALVFINLDRQGLISRIDIQYTPTKWKDSRAFAKNLSTNLKLPFNAWRYPDEWAATMQCKEFTVKTDSHFNRLILISKTSFKP